ncbi:hypothetical protein [Actinophytocola glycyrrhizae]|uniref:Uncharacterized protein n=1 Tax=Actinophytocola glycyrrhizae TaxID=2044873 RepID=A0ABV9RZN1_9PSEU
MTTGLTVEQVATGVACLVVLAWVWRAGARRARAAADAARSGARLLSLTGRVLFTAGVIVGVQWLVLTHPSVNGWAVVAALGLPALFASYTLTRALTVTTVDLPRRRGGRR